MTIGIYCITSPSGNTYIGSSINIEKRWLTYKRLHCKTQKALYASFVKYGYNNHKFQIICICEKEKLLWHEQYYIDSFKPELNIAKVVGRPAIKEGCEHPNWKGGVSSDSEYNKKHYQANKDKILEQSKEYYQINRDKILKKQKENIKENDKEYQKQYREANKERKKEYMKDYRETNKEYKKEYNKQYYQRKKCKEHTIY